MSFRVESRNLIILLFFLIIMSRYADFFIRFLELRPPPVRDGLVHLASCARNDDGMALYRYTCCFY
jgi:hypothetical protein